jgi:hypothetical protein
VPHDELGEGEQDEELYLVVEGRARFTCDGEPGELRPGELLYAPPIWASDGREPAGRRGGASQRARLVHARGSPCSAEPWRVASSSRRL